MGERENKQNKTKQKQRTPHIKNGSDDPVETDDGEANVSRAAAHQGTE